MLFYNVTYTDAEIHSSLSLNSLSQKHKSRSIKRNHFKVIETGLANHFLQQSDSVVRFISKSGIFNQLMTANLIPS